MTNPLAHALQRIASTILVLAVLFVMSTGAAARPAEAISMADAVPQCTVSYLDAGTLAAADESGAPDDAGSLPSIEDNGGGLDDTFDLPRDHGIAVSRRRAGHPGAAAPGPHAHHPSLELRPPIA